MASHKQAMAIPSFSLFIRPHLPSFVHSPFELDNGKNRSNDTENSWNTCGKIIHFLRTSSKQCNRRDNIHHNSENIVPHSIHPLYP